MNSTQKKSDEIFRKIENTDEKSQLLNDLISSQTLILGKGKADVVLKMIGEEYISESNIKCRFDASSEKPIHTNDSIICHFFLGAEKYFFKAELLLDGANWKLEIQNDIYHLQRRQDFRIRIPRNYKGFLSIDNINKESFKFKATLRDVSMGGCGIHLVPQTKNFKADIIQANREIRGILEVNRRPPIPIVGTIRYVRFDNESYTAGIEFKNRTHELDRAMFTLTMDLHREIFSGPIAS